MASLKQAQFFSLVLDESTNISVPKKLLIYVKVLQSFQPQVHYLQNVDISSDCTADVIVRKVRDVFDSQSVSVPLTKLVSVGTDGASVMTGIRGGVVTLLKRDNPYDIVHCFANKLALCNSQAAEDVAFMNDVRQTLTDLFYFSKSAKRTGKLREVLTFCLLPL